MKRHVGLAVRVLDLASTGEQVLRMTVMAKLLAPDPDLRSSSCRPLAALSIQHRWTALLAQ